MAARKIIPYLLLLLGFILYISPHFFHKLGQSSLTSFDEAWYASIAGNIHTTGDIFRMQFNGSGFYDHPPAGFWLISISQSIFGNSEYGSRMAAALLGLLCLALIFLIGTLISHPSVGLSSAILLSSSPWFISRSRSANLDISLTFFFLLTFLLATLLTKSSLAKTARLLLLILFTLSLSLLLLTKTLVPFTIFPALLFLFVSSQSISPHHLFFLFSPLLFFLIWVLSQISTYPAFISKYFTIGIPKIERQTTLWQNILLTKTYLHESIGEAFRPLVLSLPLTIFSLNRPIISFLIFISIFLAPFAFSSRGQIWHLIPIIPFLIIVSLHAVYSLLRLITMRLHFHPAALLLVLSLMVSFPQISKNWREFIDIPAYVSDEAILSRKAAEFPDPLYIDDRFLPTAVYYPGKNVIDTPTPDFLEYFNKSNPILLITHDWRLNKLGKTTPDRYQIIARDRDKVLLLISPDHSEEPPTGPVAFP